jgi:hypothetical protein
MVQFDFGKFFRILPPSQRLAALNIRPDLAKAAARMVSDERSDVEVKQLERFLSETESVISLIEGRHLRRMGLLALTTERVVFRPHRCAANEVISSPLDAVWSVENEARGMTSRLRLKFGESTLEIDKILGTQGAEFGDALRSQIAQPGPLPARDPLQELVELRARHAAGTISEEEYREEKARLLDEL